MAGKLRGKGRDAVTTHVFVAFNAANNVWNGAAFESWLDAHITDYAITATQQGLSTWFIGDEPAGAAYYLLVVTPIAVPLVVVWEDTLPVTTPTGPSQVTLTFTDQDSNPAPFVNFSIVGQGGPLRADSFGVAVFGLFDGTYSVVAAPTGGVSFATTPLVVSGTTPLTIVGSAANIPTPPAPGLATGYGTTFDGHGAAKANVTVTFQLTNPNDISNVYQEDEFTAVSDGAGLLTVTLLKGAEYLVRTANGTDIDFTVGEDDTYALPNVLGGF